MGERNEYAALSRQINAAHLLDRQPRYYFGKTLLTAAMLALSIAVLILVDNLWLQLLNVVFLSFVFGQIGFLSHDASHYQIFKDPKKNECFSMVSWGALLGVSPSAWANNHNKHHSHPNHAGEDPDIDLPVLAFSEEQADKKRGYQRFMVTYQAYFFPFLFMLLALRIHIRTIRFILSGRARSPIAEGVLVLTHFAWYLGLIFSFLPFGFALLFILINNALTGFYLASAFAPNHKGMPIMRPGNIPPYLRMQVMTARNVRPSFFTDILYGGLNYQIEHHLYPTMPRNNLRRAKQIVMEFCKRQRIPYHETSIARSYWEIFRELHRVSTVLR